MIPSGLKLKKMRVTEYSAVHGTSLRGPPARHVWHYKSADWDEIRGVETYIHEVGIRRLDWPAQSPNVNPIEHVWDVLKRRGRSVQPFPRNIRELKRVIVEELRFPQNIVESIPRRIQAVIMAKGSHT
ncbi:unnamed protein product [Pieris macdunnoughi]|uniref:Tc1-like transposase DDE domain-containing protein n=1 Tax=Pieris macdunnoughi TaxID=345717 RepID=A0A821U4F3_9NEOP|nr:unnamed protein product [Pieris macdunnoughi]